MLVHCRPGVHTESANQSKESIYDIACFLLVRFPDGEPLLTVDRTFTLSITLEFL